MSLFERVAGREEPKIAVWPLMMDMTRVLDGELSMQDFAADYELSSEEVTQATEWLTHCGSLVQSRTTTLAGVGIPIDLATVIARGTVDNQLRYGLLRCEHGTIDEATMRANLGMDK